MTIKRIYKKNFNTNLEFLIIKHQNKKFNRELIT